jgi:cytochrome c551/c552
MNIEHNYKQLPQFFGLLFSLFILFSISGLAQDATNGENLFNTKGCVACHSLDVKKIGPPLKSISDKRSKEWLYSFIKNSQKFKETNADAKAIIEEFANFPMPAHELSNAEIDDIIAYTNGAPVKKETVAPVEKTEAKDEATKDVIATGSEDPYQRLDSVNSNWWWQWIVLLLFVVIIYFFAKKKWNFGAIFFTIIALFSTAYFMFNYLFQIGVDSGYKPVQPIEFSHRVHAGDNGIDCEYCHSSAKNSKTSGIPTTNVCMNCHKGITEYKGELFAGKDKAFFDGEIAKVHAAAGWSPKDFAYTSEGKAVEWTRVHNLPDFVYYNHSQHVNVAGLECQTCHGPVEEMNRVEQFSPLTMDWCISCHRETEVNMENGYYTGTYEHLKEAHKGATVADMGGQECGKCHY